MEKAIKELDGVNEAAVNFLTRKLIIEGKDEKMPAIVQEAEKIVKKIEPGVVIKKA